MVFRQTVKNDISATPRNNRSAGREATLVGVGAMEVRFEGPSRVD
jgi:hypothetical protein